VEGIEADRLQTWRIVRVGDRIAQQIALRHVLYPAANLQQNKNSMQHDAVVRMIQRLHQMWFRRSKELLANDLWCPGERLNRQSELWTARRIMNCRPSCVFFKGGNENRIRPCKRHKICPFCWARVASLVYRRFKHRLRRSRVLQDDMILTCRVISQHVPAIGFHSASGLSPDDTLANIKQLRAVIDKYKSECQQLGKQLQRVTTASAWRIVVDPQENGWNVEMRQLLMAKPKARLPLVRLRNAKTIFLDSAKTTDDDALELLIGQFVEYPPGLLTTYSELTAVYLNATHAARLVSGTGLFRACGQGLTHAFKLDKRYGELPLQCTEEDRCAV
jgi:hypothetical protein